MFTIIIRIIMVMTRIFSEGYRVQVRHFDFNDTTYLFNSNLGTLRENSLRGRAPDDVWLLTE